MKKTLPWLILLASLSRALAQDMNYQDIPTALLTNPYFSASWSNPSAQRAKRFAVEQYKAMEQLNSVAAQYGVTLPKEDDSALATMKRNNYLAGSMTPTDATKYEAEWASFISARRESLENYVKRALEDRQFKQEMAQVQDDGNRQRANELADMDKETKAEFRIRGIENSAFAAERKAVEAAALATAATRDSTEALESLRRIEGKLDELEARLDAAEFTNRTLP